MSLIGLRRAALAAAILGVFACSSEDPVDSRPPGVDDDLADEIDAHIRSLPDLPFDDPVRTESEPGESLPDGDYTCRPLPVSETRAYDQIIAFSANSEAMWTGALVRGDSVYNGRFTQLVFDRTPQTISVSLENLDGNKSATIDSPSLSSFREALSEILSAEVTGATPARVFSEIEQVHNREQVGLALGAGASWPGLPANLSASFDFDGETARSRYIVKFTQAYYTVDVDQPGKPHEVFGPDVELDEIEATMYEGNPPVYVSSITYGRLVVFTFESEYSSEEMKAALQFGFKGGSNVTGDVSVDYTEMLSRTKITAFILGGSGEAAVQAIDSYDALVEFIKQGGNYSKDSPGAPIAYKLSYLRDNSPVRLSFTTDYEELECERVSQQVRVTLESIEVLDAGSDEGTSDLELYGIAGVATEDPLVLFDKSPEEVVTVAEGARFPSSGIIGEGILGVKPQPGEVIPLGAHLVDQDSLSADDVICDEQIVDAAFESGWRRSVELLCTGDDAQIKLTFQLQPI